MIQSHPPPLRNWVGGTRIQAERVISSWLPVSEDQVMPRRHFSDPVKDCMKKGLLAI